MEHLTESIQNLLGIQPEVQMKLLITICIIFGLWVLRFIILKIVWKQTEDIKTRYIWKRGLTYTFSFLGIFIVGAVWVDAIGRLGAFLGLLSAGLAIALKDPLTNIAGWLFIIIRKPFSVGDRIQIGENTGDVIDIRIFQFTLMEIGNWVEADQSTGRIIHVPNGKVFLESQANYSKGFNYIWNEIPVLITFESDWKKAKQILSNIVNEHAEHLSKFAERQIKEASKKFMIFYKHLTPIVYTDVKDSGVLLTIRYLTDPLKRRSTQHEIWENVLEEFSKHADIDFAYPTQRFYSYSTEKEDLKKNDKG
jgi:small-conductance mechanosensitive channel